MKPKKNEKLFYLTYLKKLFDMLSIVSTPNYINLKCLKINLNNNNIKGTVCLEGGLKLRLQPL